MTPSLTASVSLSMDDAVGQEVLALVKASSEIGVDVRRVALQTPQPSDVLVMPVACGLCGSDVKTYGWHVDRRPFLLSSMPVMLGHEVTGVVVDVGSEVDLFRPGDRFVTDPLVSCGTCRLCRSGRPNICVHRRQIGYQVNGGAAELAFLPSRSLVKLPDEVGWAEAPVLEVLAIAVHAIERAGLVSGQPCAVVGAGPLGLMLVRALKAAGASLVTCIGTPRSPARLEQARVFGADEVFDTRHTAGHADTYEVVFEVGGTPDALVLATEIVRRGGRIIYASGFDTPPPVRLNSALKNREVDLLTSTGHPPTAWERAMSLAVSGRVRLDSLVDRIVPLQDSKKGLREMYERSTTKCLVVCNPDMFGSPIQST